LMEMMKKEVKMKPAGKPKAEEDGPFAEEPASGPFAEE